MMHRAILALLALSALAGSPPSAAADREVTRPRTDTPSGLPVPRFVALKYVETRCRIGPSFQHPVRFTFRRRDAPMLVISESTDHWRKLRDPDGDECWAHKSTLRNARHVMTMTTLRLRQRPDPASGAAASFESGVLARVVEEKRGWRLLSANGVRGWAPPQARLWGDDAMAAFANGGG